MASIYREKQIVAYMTGLYCRKFHNTPHGGICDECSKLVEYAHKHLDRCPHGKGKPSCKNCAIHCYAPQQREKMRQVMRYAGPRMIYRKPIAAIRHLLNL